MPITIGKESPLTKDAARLIEGSEAALRAVYSEDECFTFSAEELARPEISFFVARNDGEALGCVALVDFGDYGEVKRLFVTPAARGKGIAVGLMECLEQQAQSHGMACIRLETGTLLAEAVRLYRQRGYKTRGPFGDYDAHPTSLFLEKPL